MGCKFMSSCPQPQPLFPMLQEGKASAQPPQLKDRIAMGWYLASSLLLLSLLAKRQWQAMWQRRS